MDYLLLDSPFFVQNTLIAAAALIVFFVLLTIWRFRNAGQKVAAGLDEKTKYYTSAHTLGGAQDDSARNGKNTQEVVKAYYDSSTELYQRGWGDSFHFGARQKHQTHHESLISHEKRIVDVLRLKENHKVLDIGCGIGGPARNISAMSGCEVVGVNLNDHQLEVARSYNAKRVSYVKSDFMNLPAKFRGTFDHAYAIEATCHAPDRQACFREIHKALRPDGELFLYEWATTGAYDPKNNKEHDLIRAQIEIGNGLPYLHSKERILADVEQAGFKIISWKDLANDVDSPVPWYQPFMPAYFEAVKKLFNRKTFQEGQSQLGTTPIGIRLVHYNLVLLEFLGIVPKGISLAHTNLLHASKGLVAGGKHGIFTPMLMIHAKKI